MLEDMEQVLEQMKQETRFTPKEIIFCNVIAFYGRSRSSEKALRTFEQIPSFRCQRTVRSFNSLLNALLKCRELEKIREFFMNVDKYACPDTCTYNILINACCLYGSLGDAWNFFVEMRRKGIQPNVITFGTLISGLCANSKLDEAFMLKEDMMRIFHVKPNAFVYTSLIKGLCQANELSLAFKLKEEMLLEDKIGLDSAVYSTLIGALFRAGRKEEVPGILEEMTRTACKPDTVTYNAMICGFCEEKDFESAFGVLNEMVKTGCKPDVISYNVILASFCKEGRVREARDLFEDMPRRGCAPDVVSYRIIFDGLSDVMEVKEAAFILDEMVFKGYNPHVSRVNKFLDNLCQEGNMELVYKVLNNLVKGNVTTVDTWSMMINMVCKEFELLDVSELVDTLVKP